MSSQGIEGKVALVIGATSGIGAATAEALAVAGATVVVVGRRAERGQAVAGAICAAGGRARFHQADVTSSDDIAAMVGSVLATEGSLDIAVNSAGIFDRDRTFHTYDDSSWDDMLAVNLTGVFRCMKAELKAMLESGGGSIVNIASTVSHRGSERASPAYVATKHAMLGLTRQAALEYVDRGIRVNAVSPGPTRTDISQPLVDEGPDAVRQALSALNPTGCFIDAADVAKAVVYLCSDGAGMINGQDVVIDGGQLAKL